MSGYAFAMLIVVVVLVVAFFFLDNFIRQKNLDIMHPWIMQIVDCLLLFFAVASGVFVLNL